MLGIQKRATIPSQDDDVLLKSAQFKVEGLLSKVHLNSGVCVLGGGMRALVKGKV